VPAFIAPQIPVLSAQPPAGEGWIHEIKHDGFRTLVRLNRGQAQAFTRNGYDWSDKYQRVIDACHKLRCRSALIDGEIIVQDAKGVSDFAVLRAAIKREPHRLVMFAFDLLFIDGADVRRLPLVERRERLRKLIPADPRSSIQFNDITRVKERTCSSGPAPWAWRVLSQSECSAPTRVDPPNSGSRPRMWWRAS
jgi:ATP-dependent DNA ligase